MGYPGTTLLKWLLRRLPAGWLAALDAWSYRVAQSHAQRRREGGKRGTTGKLRSVLKS